MYFYQAPISDKSFVSTTKENLRSHKVRLRRNKQQLFASVTTLLACFHCAVHWTWQLACKPVSVWFGCSADKLDSVVLSVGALLSALFWYDATVSLLDDFQCCTILDSNFLILELSNEISFVSEFQLKQG